MSCKWVELVAHLYIGRGLVYINDVTSKKIIIISSCDAEAPTSFIYVLLSIRAHATGYLSWYFMANVRMVAERRNGLHVSPKGCLVNR